MKRNLVAQDVKFFDLQGGGGGGGGGGVSVTLD